MVEVGLQLGRYVVQSRTSSSHKSYSHFFAEKINFVLFYPNRAKEKNFHGQFKATLVEKKTSWNAIVCLTLHRAVFSPAWLWIGHENSPLQVWGRSAEISARKWEYETIMIIQVQYKVQSSKSSYWRSCLSYTVQGRRREWTNCTTPRPVPSFKGGKLRTKALTAALRRQFQASMVSNEE